MWMHDLFFSLRLYHITLLTKYASAVCKLITATGVFLKKKSPKTYFMLAEDEVRLRRKSFLLLVISCSKLIWRWRYLVMVSSRISEILSKVWWHLTFSFSNAISLCKQKCIVESRIHTIWEPLSMFQKMPTFQ